MSRLILASASRARLALLEAAGLVVDVDPADIDETAIKKTRRAAGADALGVALALAEAKARAVARRHPETLVIGADQMLVMGDDWFDKPADQAAAEQQLRRLSGNTHHLLTSVAVVRDDQLLWHHDEVAALTMRRFTDLFLEGYLADTGEALTTSVGAYQLEGLGIQLFDRVEGDHFTILGLPLLPLLAYLRSEGALPR